MATPSSVQVVPENLWIQWPILAAFLVVVFFVGKFLVDRAKSDAEYAQKQAEIATVFIQELARNSIATSQAQVSALEGIVKESTKAIGETKDALVELSREIRDRRKESQMNFERLSLKVESIQATLEKIKGQA